VHLFSREPSGSCDVLMVSSCDYAGSFMRAKLLQFHENYRPAYYGTWRKRSSVITARRPWQQDSAFFAYDVDSDEEWEEEEPGESLSHSEVFRRYASYISQSHKLHKVYRVTHLSGTCILHVHRAILDTISLNCCIEVRSY